MLSSISALKNCCKNPYALKSKELLFTKLFRQGPKVALWGAAGGIAFFWYAYPALTEKFKSRVGLPNTLGVKKGELGPFAGLPQADVARRGNYEQENIGTAPESK